MTLTHSSDTGVRDTEALAGRLVSYLETGIAPDGLFRSDVFCDFTMPLWRLQAQGVAEVVALRRAGHPAKGQVPRRRVDATEGGGFVLEVEEIWEAGGDSWYCRELFRCDVVEGSISQISVYCTGDWDSAQVARHRAAVQLIRP